MKTKEVSFMLVLPSLAICSWYYSDKNECTVCVSSFDKVEFIRQDLQTSLLVQIQYKCTNLSSGISHLPRYHVQDLFIVQTGEKHTQKFPSVSDFSSGICVRNHYQGPGDLLSVISDMMFWFRGLGHPLPVQYSTKTWNLIFKLALSFVLPPQPHPTLELRKYRKDEYVRIRWWLGRDVGKEVFDGFNILKAVEVV